MKRMFLAALMVLITLALTGCGGSSSPPPTFVTSISSDPAVDGDITQDLAGGRSLTQGMTPTVQSVFAGIDPVTGEESRAFLDFPLANVPLNAAIVSATLHITIDSIVLQSPTSTIPIRIELVSFQPPTLQLSDFDRAILQPLEFTTITPPISLADVSSRTVIVDIPVDVTLLMANAQNFRLSSLDNFQIRILENFGVVSPGLMEINDTTGADRGIRAPLLEVTYF